MGLELKKKEMELKRVLMAKEEMQLRIEERLDEIERIKEQMANQDAACEKIKLEIETLKKESK